MGVSTGSSQLKPSGVGWTDRYNIIIFGQSADNFGRFRTASGAKSARIVFGSTGQWQEIYGSMLQFLQKIKHGPSYSYWVTPTAAWIMLLLSDQILHNKHKNCCQFVESPLDLLQARLDWWHRYMQPVQFCKMRVGVFSWIFLLSLSTFNTHKYTHNTFPLR